MYTKKPFIHLFCPFPPPTTPPVLPPPPPPPSLSSLLGWPKTHTVSHPYSPKLTQTIPPRFAFRWQSLSPLVLFFTMVSLTFIKLSLAVVAAATIASAGRPAGQRAVRRSPMHPGQARGWGSDSGSSGSGSGSDTSLASGPSGSGSGGSGSGGSYSGRATYYQVGEGACGGVSSPNEHVVALNQAMYGDSSQQSSWCNKKISITNPKTHKTVDAAIVDDCPTCPHGALDLSQSLFGALTNGNYDEGCVPLFSSSLGLDPPLR